MTEDDSVIVIRGSIDRLLAIAKILDKNLIDFDVIKEGDLK